MKVCSPSSNLNLPKTVCTIAIRLRCDDTTPLLAPVVPDEQRSVATSSWLIRSLTRVPLGSFRIICGKVVTILMPSVEVVFSSSRSTIGSVEPASFGTSWLMVKARTGFESAICLAISCSVLRGLVVVIMAPSDMTARQTIGKKIELGERRRMT